jgi:hypothetical protein
MVEQGVERDFTEQMLRQNPRHRDLLEEERRRFLDRELDR